LSGTNVLHEQPENQHVKFNIDVKVYNEPKRVFTLMDKTITSYPDWKDKLAPRIILGLWHPRFLSAAKAYLPYCRRSHIGTGPNIARRYFWDDCDAFSMWFPGLATADGEKWVLATIASASCLLTMYLPDSVSSARRLGKDSWYGP
jgi:phosphatidylglycerol phospholipase C